MCIAAVIAIVGAHDARYAASGWRCRCPIEAAGPGLWPGSAGGTANASDVQAAGRPVLTRAAAAAPFRDAKGRRHDRTSRTLSVSGPCHYLAAPVR
jgi:hypothetical protein